MKTFECFWCFIQILLKLKPRSNAEEFELNEIKWLLEVWAARVTFISCMELHFKYWILFLFEWLLLARWKKFSMNHHFACSIDIQYSGCQFNQQIYLYMTIHFYGTRDWGLLFNHNFLHVNSIEWVECNFKGASINYCHM